MVARRHSGIAPRATGHVAIAWRGEGVVDLVFAGYIDGDAVRTVDADVTEGKISKSLLFDAGEATGFDSSAHGPLIALLGRLKAAGVQRSVCVAPFSTQRIAATAVAFVA